MSTQTHPPVALSPQSRAVETFHCTNLPISCTRTTEMSKRIISGLIPNTFKLITDATIQVCVDSDVRIQTMKKYTCRQPINPEAFLLYRADQQIGGSPVLYNSQKVRLKIRRNVFRHTYPTHTHPPVALSPCVLAIVMAMCMRERLWVDCGGDESGV